MLVGTIFHLCAHPSACVDKGIGISLLSRHFVDFVMCYYLGILYFNMF